jgi:hypothetical protein
MFARSLLLAKRIFRNENEAPSPAPPPPRFARYASSSGPPPPLRGGGKSQRSRNAICVGVLSMARRELRESRFAIHHSPLAFLFPLQRGEAERRQTQNQPPHLRMRRALSGARTPVGVPPRLLHRRTNATAQLQPCFLGRGFDGCYPSSAYPSPARSAQAGHRAGRTVSRAARERTANPPASTAPAPPHGLPPEGVPWRAGFFPSKRCGDRCQMRSLNWRRDVLVSH